MVFNNDKKLSEIIETQLEKVTEFINKYPINFAGLNTNYPNFNEPTIEYPNPKKSYLSTNKNAMIQSRLPLSNAAKSVLYDGRINSKKYEQRAINSKYA